MSLDLNGLRGIAEAARSVAAPIRTTKVVVRRRVWAASRGLGTPTNTDFSLPSYVPVRKANSREVAASGGLLTLEDVMVGPITPDYPGGGISISQFAPTANDDLTEIVYVLSGGVTGEYVRLSSTTDRPFRYMLTLRRKETTP